MQLLFWAMNHLLSLAWAVYVDMESRPCNDHTDLPFKLGSHEEVKVRTSVAEISKNGDLAELKGQPSSSLSPVCGLCDTEVCTTPLGACVLLEQYDQHLLPVSWFFVIIGDYVN